jgi:hypothetical protein
VAVPIESKTDRFANRAFVLDDRHEASGVNAHRS